MIDKQEVIDYFKEYEEVNYEVIPRELKVPLDSDFIVSIIGPRRAGKTFSLYHLINSSHIKDEGYIFSHCG